MNYRHAFHAGNPADCLKHALLLGLLAAMARKPKPFAVLDTHAGHGRYTLAGGDPACPAEWQSGIGRLLALDPAPPPLQPYLDAVRAPMQASCYPGSPALIRAHLRPTDRLIACEQHPAAVAALRHVFRGDRQVQIHHRDGYAALPALLPVAERRALVLIDPPFEDRRDWHRIAAALSAARTRMEQVVIAAWYPIKHRAPVRAFHDALHAAGLRDLVAAELLWRAPLDPTRLNGCGLLLASPPFRFEVEARPVLEALRDALADPETADLKTASAKTAPSDTGAHVALHRLADA